MIRKLLAAIAVLSLLVCLTLLVLWWRSKHGHGQADEFTLGRPTSTQTRFIFDNGFVMVQAIQHSGTTIDSRTYSYTFGTFIAYTLMVPALMVALVARGAIRKRMRRGLGPRPTPPLTAASVPRPARRRG